MAHPQEEDKPEPPSNSPAKSDKVSDHLKNTASTTASSALSKTIDKIKQITNNRASNGSNGSRNSSKSNRQKGLALNDFVMLKFLEEGQFGAVYLVKYIIADKDTKWQTSSALWKKYQNASLKEKRSSLAKSFAKLKFKVSSIILILCNCIVSFPMRTIYTWQCKFVVGETCILRCKKMVACNRKKFELWWSKSVRQWSSCTIAILSTAISSLKTFFFTKYFSLHQVNC